MRQNCKGEMNMEFMRIRLKDDIIIHKIISVHYFEFSKDYTFPGESHDFWELVYVDAGTAIATSGSDDIRMNRGDMIFHKPNEWHNLRADGVIAPNVFIITFECASSMMKRFRDRTFKIGNMQKSVISKILDESTRAFSSPLGDPYNNTLIRRSDAPVGCEQLIRQYLSELLILLLREDDIAIRSTLKSHVDNELFNYMSDYMAANISKHLTLDDIAVYANVSKSSVKRVFKAAAGMGAIEYFIKMKIECAKTYIREGNYNLTQISELLGYDSIHYFSNQFKKLENMSPSDYSKSVKALIR